VAEVPAKIRAIINRYLTELEKNHFPVKKAVVFGSYAEGRANENGVTSILRSSLMSLRVTVSMTETRSGESLFQ
jgi:predicted nucleotidyltransferase